MKFAIIENNTVVNIAVSEIPLADNWVLSDTAEIGDLYEHEKFIKYEPTQDVAATQTQSDIVRQQRNTLLSSTDWSQVADSPVNKETWATYRQSLRDVPTQDGFPWEIVWPTQP